MKIGELAKTSKLKIDTIRYYEKIGLLPKPDRSESGYRCYDEQYVHYLNFIHKAKDLGFTLEEIARFISLKFENGKCEDVKDRISLKIRTINKKISELNTIKNSLKSFEKKCNETVDSNECTFWDELKIIEEENNEKRK